MIQRRADGRKVPFTVYTGISFLGGGDGASNSNNWIPARLGSVGISGGKPDTAGPKNPASLLAQKLLPLLFSPGVM